MKNTIKTLSFIFTLAVTSNLHAKLHTGKYDDLAKQIVILENNKNFKQAALKSAFAANEIANELGFDQVVQSIATTLNKNQQEVVVENLQDHGSISILAGLLRSSYNQSHDVTKILTTNAEEVEQFDERQRDDFVKLQKKLTKYVQANELAIVYAKAFSAKAIILTSKLKVEDMHDVYFYTIKTAQRVSNISFFGTQNIEKCTTINHASTTSRSDLSISSFLVSLDLGKVDQKNSYSETSCETASNSTGIGEENFASLANLTFTDGILKEAKENLSLKLLTDSEAPIYPTWGSSYY